MNLTRTVAALLFVAAGCASTPHFPNRAILWHDPDDLPIPSPPKRRDPAVNWEGVQDTVVRPLQRAFSLDYGGESRNVNALDEVPDSTWFVDRRRDPSAPDDQPRWHSLAPEVVERGAAATEDGPVAPLLVLQEKVDGSAAGFVVQDSRGIRYMLKLDPIGNPGLETSIEVVASRLAWAAGWNVPAVTLVDIQPQDLRIASDAWTLDRWNHPVPFTAQYLSELLAPITKQGSVRVVASRWIEGDLLGWFSYMGRNKHDPNDRVRHQDRRDLRGFGIWSAWVDDIDTFANNTLDTYVGEKGQGHVVHYQQGVGASFGRFAGKPIPYWMGLSPYFSPASLIGSMVTLGLLPRPWLDARLERARDAQMLEWPQFGFFDAEHFDPKRWKPVADNPAFIRQTRRDRYWGAKQVVAFNQDEVRAAIRSGGYPADAAEHLFQVLWKRREKIARAFFSEVSPLDHFRLDREQVCFEDLWLTAGLGGEGGTSYVANEIVPKGRDRSLVVDQRTRCVTLPVTDGYHIVSLGALRPGERHPKRSVRVHLMEAGGVRHVVGIQR